MSELAATYLAPDLNTVNLDEPQKVTTFTIPPTPLHTTTARERASSPVACLGLCTMFAYTRETRMPTDSQAALERIQSKSSSHSASSRGKNIATTTIQLQVILFFFMFRYVFKYRNSIKSQVASFISKKIRKKKSN